MPRPGRHPHPARDLEISFPSPPLIFLLQVACDPSPEPLSRVRSGRMESSPPFNTYLQLFDLPDAAEGELPVNDLRPSQPLAPYQHRPASENSRQALCKQPVKGI